MDLARARSAVLPSDSRGSVLDHLVHGTIRVSTNERGGMKIADTEMTGLREILERKHGEYFRLRRVNERSADGPSLTITVELTRPLLPCQRKGIR